MYKTFYLFYIFDVDNVFREKDYLCIFQKLDPLTSLSKASAQWEKRIHKSLNSMCSDLETSLAKIRPQSEQEELADKWNELSTYGLGKLGFLPQVITNAGLTIKHFPIGPHAFQRSY